MPFAGLVHTPLICHVRVAQAFNRLATIRVSTQCSNSTNRRCTFNLNSLSRRAYSAPTQSSLHNVREKSREQQTLVFQSTSDNPYHNLAIEHFLLTHSDVNSRILLFYTNRPCVVIGRNQNPWTESNLKLIQEGVNGRPLDFVRRRSGGGTVFHDEGNLNFSVIVPNDQDFSRRKHSELVVRALNEIHTVSAEYDGPENIWVNDRHDITMATLQNKSRSEFKVSGSAFKLTRGRALHHGTLLHSSPNLGNISKLLKSPGRDWIQARGVESVRSPVMNLYNVQNNEERDHIRSQITQQIVKEFLRFYNSNVDLELVGDQDCLHEKNPSIAKGVEELQTNEWRFDQTPRFDFTSKSVYGKEVTFSVRHGEIEEPRFGPKEISVEQRSRLKQQQQRKIYEIQDWCDVFDPETVDATQLAIIAQVFPDMQKILSAKTADSSIDDGTMDRGEQGIVRRFRDGTAEKERGFNTVEVTR